jgi:membrane-bound serine protease (ClpP class)|tara:strand:- start:1512 stop:2909 length:1398 start_codon:yes stop_codon:yes gene_type:complete
MQPFRIVGFDGILKLPMTGNNNRVLRILRLALLLCLLTLVLQAAGIRTAGIRAASPTIEVLQVKGIINPILVDYVRRGINHAEESNAIAAIIQLDTPGGLDTSMRDIVKDIVTARIPVVVYVSPAGGRAASAGVFITVAAHIAAMAPNTAIGAAHPVSIGAEGETQMSPAMEEKVVSDAAAYIRSIAQAQGRNMEWVEEAVRESVSATEQEALKLNVIDIVADDLDGLIGQLDGWQVTMLGGAVVVLKTEGATIRYNQMNIVEDFLYTISDPNIAYLLLSLGTLGIIAIIYNPGLIFPGVVGGISLLFGFYALGVLPVNYAGLLLIVLAFALFIAELFTPTFGLLTAGGLVSLVLGSLILFKGGPLFRVDPWLIVIVAVLIGGFLVFAITQVIAIHRRQASTGWEDLVGKTAVVKVALAPVGMVFFRGEFWSAISETGRIEPGEEVTISRIDGLKLYVTKKRIME